MSSAANDGVGVDDGNGDGESDELGEGDSTDSVVVVVGSCSEGGKGRTVSVLSLIPILGTCVSIPRPSPMILSPSVLAGL